MSLRVHQIEVATLHLPRWFPAFPIHPATMGTSYGYMQAEEE